MEQNKTGKYLKYAIGEIVLVVIGILIALQINNFNEQRKDRLKEQVVLNQLKEDYQADLIQLEQKMAIRNMIINSGLQILSAFDKPNRVVRDSLIKHIADVTNDPTFDPIKNDLISTGNLRLITNEKLKRLLSNWSSDVVALKEIEVTWSEFANFIANEVITELGIARDVGNSYMNDSKHLWLLDNNPNSHKLEIGTSALSSPLSEILTSKKLESIASGAIGFSRSANLQSEALVNRINEILDLIDNEIKEK